MPKVKITNLDNKPQKSHEEVAKRRKNRTSNFFLTINTNQHFNQHSEEYEKFNDKLKVSLNEIYENIGDYLKIKKDKDEYKNDTYDNNIHDVDIKSATEIGSKTGKAHSHTLIAVKHNTLVHLDYDKIKEKIKNDLQLKNFYLNNRVSSNSNANLVDYISKYYGDN